MGDLYTCGTWIVAEGREDDFAAAWQDLAEWTVSEIPGTRWAKLVQHQEKPNVFLSFGPWESAEAIETWRSSDGFFALPLYAR